MQKSFGILVGVIAFAVVLLAFMSVTVVSPGSVGVVVRMGATQSASLPEGTHFVVPFITSVVSVNTRIQKLEANATASSKDLQNVSCKIALNFQVESTKATQIYQKLGLDYDNSIIQPAIQESIKSTTAHYTAEELITKRPQVKDDVYAYIKKRLGANYIIVTDFSIVDFSFSQEFNRAIESKEVAKQKALAARNDLERIKTEAEQARERAAGEADAQKLLQQALDDRLLQLKAIEKWNGVMPVVQGNSGGAFVDVAAMMKK